MAMRYYEMGGRRAGMIRLYTHTLCFFCLRTVLLLIVERTVHIPLTLLIKPRRSCNLFVKFESPIEQGMSFIQMKPACLFERQCIAWKRQPWYSYSLPPPPSCYSPGI